MNPKNADTKTTGIAAFKNGTNGGPEKKDKFTGSRVNRAALDNKIKLVKERAENMIWLGLEKAVSNG